ncbi:PucR family transcriptional regulator [Alicyclobacillus mali (ex Roth et al. 2021)]|uniref:PucR family transcriptional regulator n=1 Tax=Alicyclobacillus mali (ex Roth et al. 2021) TaxID=1123961 RepID=UPI001A8DC3DF|nr:PucR family transcriptional regulator [Alicyclobacillus mali (ex Roth et al. 2021)]
MRVSDLFALPVFEGARWLAGKDGGWRTVESVNMMDAPDILDFLKPHELLVTTAYALRGDTEKLVELVRQMAKKGCAGLALKTQRFWFSIPEEVVAAAREAAFPLIELPNTYALGEIVSACIAHLMDRRAAEWLESMRAQKEFARWMMEGRSLDDLLNSLERAIGRPFALLEWTGERLAASDGAGETEVLSARWAAVSAEPGKCIWMCVRGGSRGTEIEAFPVWIDHPCAYLIAIGGRVSHLPGFQRMMAEVMPVLSVEMGKRQAVRDGARRASESYFEAVVSAELATEAEIVTAGKPYGIHRAALHQCVLLRPFAMSRDRQVRPAIPRSREMERLAEWSKRWLVEAGEDVSVFLWNRHVAVVRHLPSQDQAGKEGTFRALQAQVWMAMGYPVSIGIGNPVGNVEGLARSLKEAWSTLEEEQRRAGDRPVIARAGVRNLSDLVHLLPYEKLCEFREAVLGPILALPADERDVLLHTLATFLDLHGNVAETGKQLYLHRNTVLYRLGKCEQLCKLSLKDPDATLQIRLALHIHRLMTRVDPQAQRVSGVWG